MAWSVKRRASKHDQGGNRLTKGDGTRTTTYFYDTVAANRQADFPTANNRLMRYEVRQGSTLLRTVAYTYWQTGAVSNITIKDEYVNATLTPGSSDDYKWYNDLALYYTKGGAVTAVLADRWKATSPSVPIDFDEPGTFVYETISAQELLYDAPRGRYFACSLDPDTMTRTSDPEDWTDYVAMPTGLQAGLGVLAGGVGASDVPVAVDAGTADWLTGLEPPFLEKLAAVGLVSRRATEGKLQEFLDKYIQTRDDTKPATRLVYSHTRRNLIDYFGPDRPLRDITAGDADEWRLWLKTGQRLSDNTVRRRCGDRETVLPCGSSQGDSQQESLRRPGCLCSGKLGACLLHHSSRGGGSP